MFRLKSLWLLYLILCSSVLYGSHHTPKDLMDDANCMRCHTTSDFEAREEKVNSFKKLHHQVKACADNNYAGWFDEDVESVSEYLNLRYYKFHRDH